MRLRILIARRAEHPDWLVSPQLDGWLTGAIGLRKGVSQEVDEFSRAAKRALIRAAWADVRALEQRMQHGSELLATGRDFRVGGWLVPTNLLWAIENEIVTTRGINAHLPPLDEWPAALLDLLPPDAPSNNWRRTLLRVLARMLYPSTLDLHGFRVLLMAATGHTSEEVLRGDPRSNTDAARHEVLDFFLAAFDDIDPNAVPTTVHDDLYARSWSNSAMRTAHGCWVPSSPAAHSSLPVRRDEEACASLPPEPTRLLRPIPASSLNVSMSARHCNFGGRQPNKSQVVLRGYMRYTNQTGTPLLVRLGEVGDTFIPKPAGASRHRKHTFTPDTTAGTQITSTTIRT